MCIFKNKHMKLIIKNDNRDIVKNPNVKIIETTEASFTNQVVILESNDVPIIKYTDTESMYFVKDLDNLYDRKSKSEVLLNITIDNLELIGGGSGAGIESVSGNLVDNTDPLNPVIDRGYKVFKAIVIGPFSGGNITVMDILYNDVYTGTAVWSRLNIGIYKLTLNGAFSGNIFTNGKISSTNNSRNTDITYINKHGNNEIYLFNLDSSGIEVDLVTNNKYPLYFEIHP